MEKKRQLSRVKSVPWAESRRQNNLNKEYIEPKELKCASYRNIQELILAIKLLDSEYN